MLTTREGDGERGTCFRGESARGSEKKPGKGAFAMRKRAFPRSIYLADTLM